MSPLWRCEVFINWSMTLKIIQGHIRPHLCQNHSSTFVYRRILMKLCMNAIIKKTHLFHKSLWPEMYLLCYGEVLWFFYFKTFRPNYNLDLRSYGQLLSFFQLVLINRVKGISVFISRKLNKKENSVHRYEKNRSLYFVANTFH